MKLFNAGFWIIIISFFIGVFSGIRPTAPELHDYYKEYIKIVDANCSDLDKPQKLSLSFKDLGDDEIGLCNYYVFKREIFIDKTYWGKATLTARKQLVFHELTHCILNIHHVEDPNHYMNPYLYEIPEERMIDQLKIDIRISCNE